MPQAANVRRRNFIKYVGAGATVSLAGCQSEDDGGGTTGGSGEGVLSGKSIKIGGLAPDVGKWPLGTSMERGAELAVDIINQNGGFIKDSPGVLGAELEFIPKDTGLAPGQTQRKYLELVEEEKVDFTAGTFLGKTLMAIFPEMARTSTIHITTGAPTPRAGELVHDKYDKYKYQFRAGGLPADLLAKSMVETVDKYAPLLGWNRIAVLVENIGPFDRLAEHLKNNLPDIDHVDITMISRTSSSTTNWAPIFDQMEEQNVDLALVNFALTATAAVEQWYSQQRPFEFGGIVLNALDYDFWGDLNGSCEYTWSLNAFTPQAESTPTTSKFIELYNQKYSGSVPLYTGGLSFDAVHMYCKALINAVEQEGLSSKPDSDTMVQYLEDLVYSQSPIWNNENWGFRPKDEPNYAHDPIWSSGPDPDTKNKAEGGLWKEDVPVMQQWQKDETVREDYGVMHSWGPYQNRSADYQVPHWIDKEPPDGDRWLPLGMVEDDSTESY